MFVGSGQSIKIVTIIFALFMLKMGLEMGMCITSC